MKRAHTLEIFCDGACSKVGKGGLGSAVVANGEVVVIRTLAATNTTNNQMELTAALIGLLDAVDYLSAYEGDSRKIQIFTDSQYVQKGITEWIRNWKRLSWYTSGGEPVKNSGLWKLFDANFERAKRKLNSVTIHWVRGHNGHIGNELADRLATNAHELHAAEDPANIIMRLMELVEKKYGKKNENGELTEQFVLNGYYGADFVDNYSLPVNQQKYIATEFLDSITYLGK